MNAGAAIYIGGNASSIADGIAAARQVIADGSALRKLEEFIRISH
jgi:anthranilate phosphoribosyltransferase